MSQKILSSSNHGKPSGVDLVGNCAVGLQLRDFLVLKPLTLRLGFV